MKDIAIYRNKEYSFGAERNGKYDLCSLELDNNFYPIKILEGIDKKQITGAYRAIRWVKVRDCIALFEGKCNGKVILNVKPSLDVDILNAKEIDRGVFEARVDISEIERIWEERKPYLDFPFPENFDKEIEISLDDF
ncbi:MAG: hypothetical protein ACK50A_17025 [Sphingobacteriaceae bacterium]